MGSHGLKVIVTGSPRAGTSLVGGLVGRMGFSLGPADWLKPANPNNPQGYHECMPLMQLSIDLLKKLGGNFNDRLPDLGPGWTDTLAEEKATIADLVESGGIEAYKGNRLLVLADLYDELFPDAAWILCTRDVTETHRSRFGDPMTLAGWIELTEQRDEYWQRSRPAQKALIVDFSEFAQDYDAALDRIAGHAGIELSPEQRAACRELYQPRTS